MGVSIRNVGYIGKMSSVFRSVSLRWGVESQVLTFVGGVVYIYCCPHPKIWVREKYEITLSWGFVVLIDMRRSTTLFHQCVTKPDSVLDM